MSGDDEVPSARDTHSRGDLRAAAFGHFGRAYKTAELSTDDLSAYGIAAWRLGYGRESIQLSEQAFNRLIAEDNIQTAAMKAVGSLCSGSTAET